MKEYLILPFLELFDGRILSMAWWCKQKCLQINCVWNKYWYLFKLLSNVLQLFMFILGFVSWEKKNKLNFQKLGFVKSTVI